MNPQGLKGSCWARRGSPCRQNLESRSDSVGRGRHFTLQQVCRGREQAARPRPAAAWHADCPLLSASGPWVSVVTARIAVCPSVLQDPAPRRCFMNLFSVNWLHVKIEHRLHRREEAPVFKNVAFGVCGGRGSVWRKGRKQARAVE